MYIYDLGTGTWSSATLSAARSKIHASASNNKKYFAGGNTSADNPSTVVDVYDNNTRTWSATNLQYLAGGDICGLPSAGRLFWAGDVVGNQLGASRTEVKNLATHRTKIYSLTGVRKAAVVAGGNVVFLLNRNTNQFDILNISTNSLSIGTVAQTFPSNAGIISVNNDIYIAGGYFPNASFCPPAANQRYMFSTGNKGFKILLILLSKPLILAALCYFYNYSSHAKDRRH